MLRVVTACLGVMLVVGCSGKPDKTTVVHKPRFQAVYTTAKATLEATEKETTRDNFADLVRSFGIEATFASDAAQSESERACAQSYNRALEAYRESLKLWEEAGEANETVQSRWQLAKSHIIHAEQFYSGARRL